MDEQEQIERLKKRVVMLAVAFENLDAERMYLRQNLAAVRELLSRAVALLEPYAGQNNVTVPTKDPLADA